MLNADHISGPSRPLATDRSNGSESRSSTHTDNPTEHLSPEALQALQNRDPAAIERWIISQRSLLYGFLLKMVGDEEETRDLLQETFYQALRSLPKFRGASKVSTWLCSIAKNVARTHFRTKGRHKTLESKALERLDHAGESATSYTLTRNPHASTRRSEHKDLIHSALGELSTSYRQIIRLRDLQERSTREVAERLDLTKVNVRVRLHRARKQLKKLLTPRLAAEQRFTM